MEDYHNELAVMTAKLAENMRGQIGPCSSLEELWSLVPKHLGCKVPGGVFVHVIVS